MAVYEPHAVQSLVSFIPDMPSPRLMNEGYVAVSVVVMISPDAFLANTSNVYDVNEFKPVTVYDVDVVVATKTLVLPVVSQIS